MNSYCCINQGRSTSTSPPPRPHCNLSCISTRHMHVKTLGHQLVHQSQACHVQSMQLLGSNSHTLKLEASACRRKSMTSVISSAPHAVTDTSATWKSSKSLEASLSLSVAAFRWQSIHKSKTAVPKVSATYLLVSGNLFGSGLCLHDPEASFRIVEHFHLFSAIP